MSGRFHGSARLRSFHPGAGANASAKEMTNGIRKMKKCIEHVHLREGSEPSVPEMVYRDSF